MSEMLNTFVGASRVIVGQVAWASLAGGLFICLLWLACRTMPSLLSPGLKATLWWLACLKLVLALVWFAPLSLPVLSAPAAPAFQQQSANQPLLEPPAWFLTESTSVTVVQSRTVSTGNAEIVGVGIAAAALLWLSGALVSFGMLIRRARQQAVVLGTSKPLDDESTKRTVANIAARLGLRRIPLVRTTDAIESPLVTGVTHPTLLLPTTLWDRLTESEKEIAICHECVHIQRIDLFMRWIPIFAERLFFFLPLARLAARNYVLCNEATCDARVLEVLPTTPREYGNVLLAFGTSNHHAAVLAVGSSSFAVLERRIAMLGVAPTSSVGSRVVAVALVAVAIVVLTPVRPVARSTAPNAPRLSVATAVIAATQAGDSPQVRAAYGASAGRVGSPATPAAAPITNVLPRVEVVPESSVTSQNARAATPASQQPRTEAQDTERFGLVAGLYTTLSTDFDITRVAVTNPALADVVLLKPREVLVDGKGEGTVSLTIWGATRRKQYDVLVLPAPTAPSASDALNMAHRAVFKATAKVRAAATPEEQEQAKKELAEAEARVRSGQDQYRAMTTPWLTHEQRVAMEVARMEVRSGKPLVNNPDAPKVVTDFDTTVMVGQPMHFKVAVSGADPIPTLMVVLRSAGMGTRISSPTFGMNSSNTTTDARTLTDFTIMAPMPPDTTTYEVHMVVKDAQGRGADYLVGSVVVMRIPRILITHSVPS